MYGAMLALKKMEERNKFEAGRTKWTEKRDGEEFLMVHCQCCGQPWTRQKVARFDQAAIDAWKAMDKSLHPSLLSVFYTFFIFVPSAFVMYIYASFSLGALTYAILSILFISIVSLKDRRNRKRILEEKTKILREQCCDAPLEHLGLEDDYNCEVVILPKE